MTDVSGMMQLAPDANGIPVCEDNELLTVDGTQMVCRRFRKPPLRAVNFHLNYIRISIYLHSLQLSGDAGVQKCLMLVAQCHPLHYLRKVFFVNWYAIYVTCCIHVKTCGMHFHNHTPRLPSVWTTSKRSICVHSGGQCYHLLFCILWKSLWVFCYPTQSLLLWNHHPFCMDRLHQCNASRTSKVHRLVQPHLRICCNMSWQIRLYSLCSFVSLCSFRLPIFVGLLAEKFSHACIHAGFRHRLRTLYPDEFYLPTACDQLTENNITTIKDNFCSMYTFFTFMECNNNDVVIQCPLDG